MTRSFRNSFALVLVAWLLSPVVLAMSVEKEVALGKAEHTKIIAQFGVYEDPELQTYVDRIGQRIAAVSSRPELEYHFTILDDEMINAFALPGGFIYVTRGMLTHMNSESELAAVLGHEIGHVTERHAMRGQTGQTAVNIASAVAGMLTGQPALMDLGNLFGGVLLRGYSREFELEADAVGAGFMAEAGYSPEAMLKTIEVLKAKDKIEILQAREEKREPLVYHGFLSTHPDNDTRYERAIMSAASLNENYSEFIRVDEFLEKLNGMSYGNTRQIGVVRGSRFYHPKLGIKMVFPDGWRIGSNQRGIIAYSKVADAVLTITSGRLARGMTPENYLTDKLGMDLREGRALTIGGMNGYIAIANRANSPFGPRPVRVAIMFDDKRRQAYVIAGAGKHDLRKIAADREFISAIFSFDKMEKADFRIAKRPTVQIVRAEEGTTMEQLAEESPITNYALDKLRVMNGLYPDGEPEPGQLIKIID